MARNNLIILFSIYMVYTNIKMLAGVPYPSWRIEQYLLTVVTIGFVFVAIYFIKALLQKKKSDEDNH